MTINNETSAQPNAEGIINYTVELMFKLAQEEGAKFRQEYGREPTESEAGRIADMITRQLQTACALLKGSDSQSQQPKGGN